MADYSAVPVFIMEKMLKHLAYMQLLQLKKLSFSFFLHFNSLNDYFNSIIILAKIMASCTCSLVLKFTEIWMNLAKLRWEGWGKHGNCGGFQDF